jgi:hypothetical protein
MEYYPVVVQALAGSDQTVYAYFSDGHIKQFDMKPLISKGGVFKPLKNESIFKGTLTVMNGTVAWDLSGKRDPSDCIDLDPFTIYESADVTDPLELIS